jgi:phospholipid-binding lipoprotein MlaA
MDPRPSPLSRLLPALLCLLLTACASSPQRTGGPSDPLEPVNRKIYAFNHAFDRNVAQPVARGYQRVVPGPVNQGVSNFFSNLDDVAVLVNSALQLKPRATLVTANRLLVNSTLGLLGVVDVAGGLGVPKQNEDFGQTLGSWGAGSGPYLMLPVLGPSSLRAGSGRVVDAQYAPLDELADSTAETAVSVLRGIDTRASLLGTTDVLETAAVDPYIYTRDAYLRRRTNLVHDGTPPQPADDGGDGEAFDPLADDDDEDLFKQDGDNGDSSQ